MRESLLTLLGLLLLFGCGGDDGGTGPEEDPPNHRPQVFIDVDTNNRVEVAGSTVSMHAVGTDNDGDALSYRWSISGGSSPGSLSATTGETIQWTAGTDPGDAIIEVIANDGQEDSIAPGRTTLVTATELQGGTQNGNRTLQASQSPYIVTGDYTVGPSATLTVEHGTTVYLRPALGPGTNVEPLVFTVQGTLNAGTSTTGAQINFQGSRLTSVIPSAARQWEGFTFEGSAGGTLYRVSIRDAETGILNRATSTLTLRNCSVLGAITGMSLVDPDGTTGGQGVVSTTVLENCAVTSSTAFGIRLESSVLTMTGCQLSGNGTYGLWASATSDFSNVSVTASSFGQSATANLKYENNLKPFSFVVNDCNLVPGNGGINFEFGSCPFGGAFDITQNYWGVNAENDVGGILADFSGHQGCTNPDFDSWVADVDWYNTPVVNP